MNRIGVLLACLLAAPAFSAEWVRVGSPADGDQYYYDRSKVFINGDEITYWKKVVFRTVQPVKGQLAASGLYRERINCTEHTLKLISYLLYGADGSNIEYVAGSEGDAAPIIPDTLGDVFERATCALLGQKRDAKTQKGPESEPRPEPQATSIGTAAIVVPRGEKEEPEATGPARNAPSNRSSTPQIAPGSGESKARGASPSP